MSKLLKLLLGERMIKGIERKRRLSKEQYAKSFEKGRSIIDVMNRVREIVEKLNVGHSQLLCYGDL